MSCTDHEVARSVTMCFWCMKPCLGLLTRKETLGCARDGAYQSAGTDSHHWMLWNE